MIRVPMAEAPISDSIHILAIEADPVILAELITCLNRFPDLQVAAVAETTSSAWKILTDPVEAQVSIDLILL
jgi:DNA-binding NarL/FixJ family response regulator